jgi:hypothetical protein
MGGETLGDGVGAAMSEAVRCDHCGAGLKFVGERSVAPNHIHREYECPGCLHQSSACSEEGYELIQHAHD